MPAVDSLPGARDSWFNRPDELKHKLLHTDPQQRKLEEYIAAVVECAKRSYQLRIQLGDPEIIHHLCAALHQGAPSTAKAAAQAIKLLSFCHPNHKCALHPCWSMRSSSTTVHACADASARSVQEAARACTLRVSGSKGDESALLRFAHQL